MAMFACAPKMWLFPIIIRVKCLCDTSKPSLPLTSNYSDYSLRILVICFTAIIHILLWTAQMMNWHTGHCVYTFQWTYWIFFAHRNRSSGYCFISTSNPNILLVSYPVHLLYSKEVCYFRCSQSVYMPVYCD